MMKPVTHCAAIILLLFCCACRNEEQIKQHIRINGALLQKKQSELSDLNYKVTSNSLHVGTKDYDSTIGRDFPMRSGMLQTSIDSLKAQTDSLQELISK